MAWKFVDSYGCELITISNHCELELAHSVLDAVANYYSKEKIL